MPQPVAEPTDLIAVKAYLSLGDAGDDALIVAVCAAVNVFVRRTEKARRIGLLAPPTPPVLDPTFFVWVEDDGVYVTSSRVAEVGSPAYVVDWGDGSPRGSLAPYVYDPGAGAHHYLVDGDYTLTILDVTGVQPLARTVVTIVVVGGPLAYTEPIPAIAAPVAATTWPADVTQGATMLAARLHRRKNSPNGVEAFAVGGPVYVRRNDPDIAMMLDLDSPMVG